MKKGLKVWLLSLFLLWSLAFLSGSVFADKMKGMAPEYSDNWEYSSSNDGVIQNNGGKKLDSNPVAWEENKNSSLSQDGKTDKKEGQANTNSDAYVWITINTECMWGVGCGLSVYDALWIRKDRAPGERTSVMTFVQDIILGASMFIGTVAAVAFILSGVYYVFSASDASYKKKAQEGMKYAIYGLVLVTLAIVIVRITQFIARGGS